jgi:hypothetical protein
MISKRKARPSGGCGRGIEIVSNAGSAGVRGFEHLGRAVEAAKLKILIAGEYGLADAAKAHERLAPFGNAILREPEDYCRAPTKRLREGYGGRSLRAG